MIKGVLLYYMYYYIMHLGKSNVTNGHYMTEKKLMLTYLIL